MTFSMSFIRSLRNLTLSPSLRNVRPFTAQGLLRRYCTHEDEKISNLQKVARQYKDIYSSQRSGTHNSGEKDPKDRRNPIPVDTSIRYLKSKAYKNTYGIEPVWVPYKRNFKGQIAPFRTRVNCVGDDGFLRTGNPCPICRDEYLVLHYKNIELLKQFISPHDGGVYSVQKTNLCRTQYDVLLTAIMEAKELGLLTHDVPFRVYNYDYYNSKKAISN